MCKARNEPMGSPLAGDYIFKLSLQTKVGIKKDYYCQERGDRIKRLARVVAGDRASVNPACNNLKRTKI